MSETDSKPKFSNINEAFHRAKDYLRTHGLDRDCIADTVTSQLINVAGTIISQAYMTRDRASTYAYMDQMINFIIEAARRVGNPSADDEELYAAYQRGFKELCLLLCELLPNTTSLRTFYEKLFDSHTGAALGSEDH